MYSYLFLLCQTSVLHVRKAIPVRVKDVLSTQLLLKGVSCLEAQELVEVKEHIEEHA